MNSRSENDAIRAAVLGASSLEEKKAPFQLFGRGHEPRVTLDRRLAAALRGVTIPSVNISGYGANNYYPRRVFITAVRILNKTMGWSPIRVSTDGCCYRIDQWKDYKSESTTLRPSAQLIAPEQKSKRSVPDDAREYIIIKLKSAMKKKAPKIGPEFAVLLSKWATFIRPDNCSAGTDDWRVKFLAWALRGRAKEFVNWASAQTSPKAAQALAGVRRVYDYTWPHNASAGYIFSALWGWLQLELEKPGESKPASISEQMEGLKAAAEKAGRTIKSFVPSGCGGIIAVWDEEQP